MPVTERWTKHARLMDWHHCVVCGCPDWTHIRGWGFWCNHCNAQAFTREANCDSATILEIRTDACWSEATNKPPGDRACGKFFSVTPDAEPYWWTCPTEFDADWQPLPADHDPLAADD